MHNWFYAHAGLLHKTNVGNYIFLHFETLFHNTIVRIELKCQLYTI
jgi:hypothetical protein